MSVDEVLALLAERTGLDPVLVGEAGLRRAIGDWLAAHPGEDPAHGGWEALVDAVLRSETRLFSEPESFAELAARVRAGAWPGRPLRVLSLACSHGEETVSIAMALRAAGLAPGEFRILGVDASRRALAVARAGVYTAESGAVEGDDFVALEDGRLAFRWLGSIEYLQGNLLDTGLPCWAIRWEVIFCRNIMAYMQPWARARLAGLMGGALAPGGIIMAGPGEAPLLRAAGLPHHAPPPRDGGWAEGFSVGMGISLRNPQSSVDDPKIAGDGGAS